MASWNFPALNGIIRTSKNILGGRLKFDYSALTAERSVTLPDVSGAIVVSVGGDVQTDRLVRSTIAVADASGGATTALLTVDCFRLDGTTALASARQIFIAAHSTQYNAYSALSGTTTFGTATKGSIISSGSGWCLAQTNATGEFDCTVTNSADETIYFSVAVPRGGVSDVTKGLLSVISNSDAATWSA